jgi:excisionase family DNA binding protein
MAKTKESQASLTEILQRGSWSAVEVAALLDTPLSIVDRWCAVGLLPGADLVRGQWQISGRSLFLFCGRRIEPHYSPETVAALLDKTADTVRGWIKSGRMRKVKIGTAKSASVLIPESELRRWLSL